MSIILEQLTKRYAGHSVVNNVSLEISDGEFFVLLGSSGSGKTTILSMIAGLTPLDQGHIILNGRDVTYLPTQERRVGFVFQNYALFQQMTVAENIEFGLSIRKVPAHQRQRRRDELLELVGLAGLGRRMPRQISGGQQQRVALARALAYQPDVLLLDEPLGALDAKIRIELRHTLRQIQQEIKVTTILVTHDQEEAFELADRLGVMSFGRLLEVGTPEELYQYPQTEFVATFLGTANLLVGQANGDEVQVGPHHFPLTPPRPKIADHERVQVLFRPEDVALVALPKLLDCQPLGQGEVEQTTFVGSFERLRLRLPAIPGVRSIAPPVPFGSEVVLVEATRSQDQVSRLPLQAGDKVWVGVRRVHALEHPGMRFLVLTDGSGRAQAAIGMAGQMARLAHARVTLIGYGAQGEALQKQLQEAKEELGSGLPALDIRKTTSSMPLAVAQEAERQPYDMLVLGYDPSQGFDLLEELLQAGNHHLLLVPQAHPTPTKVLIGVATGEPGKEDVQFAARLIRHLGAQATLLSVLPHPPDDITQNRAERFLKGGVRTLEALGVPAQTTIHTGPITEGILNEMSKGNHELLVLGCPLPNENGTISLSGIVGQVIQKISQHPILIVQSFLPAMAVPAKSDHPSALRKNGYQPLRKTIQP